MEGKGEQLDSAFLPRVTIHAWLTMAFFIFRHEACPISISITENKNPIAFFITFLIQKLTVFGWVESVCKCEVGLSLLFT